MLAEADDHLATFSFSGVFQTIVKHSTWGQCPQVLAGTARKAAKLTRLCSYTGGGLFLGAHQGGHATARFLQKFLEDSLTLVLLRTVLRRHL